MEIKFPLGIFVIWGLLSSGQTTPAITSFEKVAVLHEDVTTNEILSTIACSDPDGDPTNVYPKSVTPSSSCAKCFEVLDCPPNECLQYRAGVGTLSYSSAQSYLVTVECTDNKEPPVTEVIEIKTIPNNPPYFAPDVKHTSVSLSGTSGPGATVGNVDCQDDDQLDTITYAMTVDPPTSAGNYAIDPNTGIITTTVDMRTECRNSVTFSVTCSDGKHTSISQVMNVQITNANVAPVCTNLGNPLMVPEDTSGTCFTMNCVDGNGNPITYSYTTNNPAGTAQFTIGVGNSGRIDAAGLDYENAALRRSDLAITVSDGYCSNTYPQSLQVTDVNEPPTMTPADSSMTVCEGKAPIIPGFQVSDPDNPDTVTWSFSSQTSNNPGRFSIDPRTGTIIPLVDYDVDGDKPSRTQGMTPVNKFVVVATDKGGKTATGTVTVTFVDCNDNAPIFDEAAYAFATTECSQGGATLGNVKATDKDSQRQLNNELYYVGSGGSVQVGTGGEVIVNTPMPAGTVVTFDVYCYDRGQTPGQLRSVNPTKVSVRFTPCPTTPPPTQAPPATTTTTAKPTIATTKYTKTGGDPNLPWIIIAALLGTLFLGLLSYMLWRYGSLCLNSCSKLNCDCENRCRGRTRRAPRIRERTARSGVVSCRTSA